MCKICTAKRNKRSWFLALHAYLNTTLVVLDPCPWTKNTFVPQILGWSVSNKLKWINLGQTFSNEYQDTGQPWIYMTENNSCSGGISHTCSDRWLYNICNHKIICHPLIHDILDDILLSLPKLCRFWRVEDAIPDLILNEETSGRSLIPQTAHVLNLTIYIQS